MTYDASAYRFLLVVIHTTASPDTGTWLATHLLPINVSSVHSGLIVFNFVTGGGSTYFDIRASFTPTSATGAFDSKTNISSAYCTVYGIK